MLVFRSFILFFLLLLFSSTAYCQRRAVTISYDDYREKVRAIWLAQMLGAMMGFQFEHKVASTQWVSSLADTTGRAPVDDDWYYEMVAIRAFEKYGIKMSEEQLGKQWLENAAGTWGSSEQARLLMQKGISPPDCGHPRYNRLWFSIGPQFSCDVYGALAPGMPNVAGEMARKYGHINGYAEGADGGVFVAGMISLGFVNSDARVIVKKAIRLIHPSSPYRQCIEMVISLCEKGKSPKEVFDATEDRWHMEYPATNNAVANGGIVAASVWFGGGDFLKTINLAYAAADFTDADCNAANAAAVVAAVHGMKCLPAKLVSALGDRIKGDKLGKITLTPAVDESISSLAERTADIGQKILQKHGAKLTHGRLNIISEEPVSQPAENFVLADLTQYWNKDWLLERAGFGGAGGGMPGIRGITYLDNDVLATYPRDEVRGVVLSRTLQLNNSKSLSFEAGVDSSRAWQCVVFVNNSKKYDGIMEGNAGARKWQEIKIDLSAYRDTKAVIRIYQRVLLNGKTAGNAYWRNLVIQ